MATDRSTGKPAYWQYLCSACAEDNGGTWPPGHEATMHEGLCDVCGNIRAVSHVTDWNWPGRRTRYCDATGREI